MGARFISAVRVSTSLSMHDVLQAAAFPLTGVVFYAIALCEFCMELLRFLTGCGGVRTAMSDLRPGLKGELAMSVYDPDDLLPRDWLRLQRDRIDRGIPFILRRKGGTLLSPVEPPHTARETLRKSCIRVAPIGYFDPLAGIDEIVARLFPAAPKAYWPLWFLGRYTQGLAHTDLGPSTCNCYFMRSGSKDVVIVPTEVTRRVTLQPGLDGLYVDGSHSEERHYLSGLPYYYRVDLLPQSMLIFNNSTCIHQFKNVESVDGSTPEALSVRVKFSVGADKRVWHNMMVNTASWWRFAGVAVSTSLLFEKAEDRDPKYL